MNAITNFKLLKTITSFLILIPVFYGCNSIEPNINEGDIDTTSHNFIWQSFIFGEHSSSALYDVAIIDENNIWAVGEIYLNDSLGQPDPHPYGIIHWDGIKWEVKRITAQNPSGGNSYIIPKGIFIIKPSEIWLASGSVFLFDGQNIVKSFWLINYSGYSGGIFNDGETAQRLWGETSSDLYTVGNNGAIAYYNGRYWQKIESGTDLDIYDIWGQKTDKEEHEILCVASDLFLNKGRQVLQIKNSIVTPVSDEGLSNSLHTIWFIPDEKYFVGGDGLFSKTTSNGKWIRNNELPAFYKDAIRGNDLNDIILVGSAGFLSHFNGKNWKIYQNVINTGSVLGRVDIKGNSTCAVGSNDNKAIVILGNREK